MVDLGLVGAVGGVLLALGALVAIMWATTPRRRRRHARRIDEQTAQYFAERLERVRR